MPDLAFPASADAVLAASFVAPVMQIIGLILFIGVAGTELYALIHAVTQRADAFTAAGKLTKPAWLAINAGALLLTLVFRADPKGLLGLIAITAALVYIVDVRPAVREVSGGSSW